MSEEYDRGGLRAEMSGEVAAVFQRHRREAEILMGDPPNPANIPAEFWEKVRRETSDTLAEFMLYLLLRSAVQHGLAAADAALHGRPWVAHEAESAGRSIARTSRELIEHAAEREHAAQAARLAAATAGEYADVHAAGAARMTEAVQAGVDRAFGPNRAANVANTQGHQSIIQGGEIAIEETGVQVLSYWRHEEDPPPGQAGADEDPCELCTPYLDKERADWDGYIPGARHLGCLCFIEYIEIHTHRTIGGKWISRRGIQKYSDDQQRVPAGQSGGGEFGSGGGVAHPTNHRARIAAKPTKSEIAKSAHHMVDAEIQRYAEEGNEPKLAKSVGGHSLADNEPVDVVIEGKDGKRQHGIEMKTIVSNKAGKLTMKKEAVARKAAWERKNKCPIHTIVYDDSAVFNANGPGKHDESKRKIYYRRGYGSFRVANMHEVTGGGKELKELMNTPKRNLPEGAKSWDTTR